MEVEKVTAVEFTISNLVSPQLIEGPTQGDNSTNGLEPPKYDTNNM